MTARIAVSVTVAAPAEKVFAAMVELPSQDRWMLATRLFALGGETQVPAVGSRMAALTGFAGLGVLDTMVVTVFDPPRRWETTHTGSAIQGVGIFSVEATASGSRVTWAEELELPLGIIGRLGFKVVGPVVRLGLLISLRRLAKGVVDGTLPVGESS